MCVWEKVECKEGVKIRNWFDVARRRRTRWQDEGWATNGARTWMKVVGDCGERGEHGQVAKVQEQEEKERENEKRRRMTYRCRPLGCLCCVRRTCRSCGRALSRTRRVPGSHRRISWPPFYRGYRTREKRERWTRS